MNSMFSSRFYKFPESVFFVFLCSFIFLLNHLSYAIEKEDRIADVIESSGMAIVNIRTEELLKSDSEDEKIPLAKKFINADQEMEVSEGYGSGVVINPNGIIVTNEHLISRAINITVKFLNGKEYDAYVLGSDPEYDIALLKITSSESLPYLKPGRRKPVRVGERAIVIGNPYGLSNSVSVGVVSALGRNLRIDNRVYVNLIQTDAAINPGNSGGALLDINGHPIGIVTAIYSEGKGIGFAIPIEDVMDMLSEFLDVGYKRPIFGLFIEKRKNERESFFYVNKVIPNSPADRYGVKAGDRIVEINKKKIKEGVKLYKTLRTLSRQDKVQLKMVRGEKSFVVDIDIKDIIKYRPSPLDEGLFDIRVSDIKGYPRLKYKIKHKEGVVVTKVYKNGLADRSGLKDGDIIVKINNLLISNKEDFDAYMMEGLKRNYILYQVIRKESIFYLPVKLDALF